MSVAQTGCPSVYLWKLKTSPCSVYEWYLLVLYIIYILLDYSLCFQLFFLNFFLLNLNSLDTRSMIDVFIRLSHLNCFCS